MLQKLGAERTNSGSDKVELVKRFNDWGSEHYCPQVAETVKGEGEFHGNDRSYCRFIDEDKERKQGKI
jgi:hypothetical protein